MDLKNRQFKGVLKNEYKKSRKGCNWEWLVFLAFVTPNLIIFLVFTYWPIIYSTFLSFTRWN
ncbi:MAG: hypothetical protein AB1798_09080, partial [Spirochaetota bacterium]